MFVFIAETVSEFSLMKDAEVTSFFTSFTHDVFRLEKTTTCQKQAGRL